MKKYLLYLLFFTVILTSCTSPRLVVISEYLNRRHLASYYVNTPDPQLDNPHIGQRLIINWHVPKSCYNEEDLKLYLKVRFHNREEEDHTVSLYKRSGTYVYDVLDEKYCTTKGILTYKAELILNGLVVETWVHQLWAELITFKNLEN